MGTFVEDLGDRLEGLLACGVPDLQLEDLRLELDDQRAEFNAYSDFMVHVELVSGYSMHQATLAYA